MCAHVRLVSVAVALLLGTEVSLAQDAAEPKAESIPGQIEVKLRDDSVMKVKLRDDKLELQTAYGTLRIPVAEIMRIDIGMRVSDEEQQKIDTAVVELNDSEFRKREAAAATLLALREKAYSALVAASKSKQAEPARRAESLLEKLREAVPAEALEVPTVDYVYTADSKIAGRLRMNTLRVSTLAFGEQQLKLTDVRGLQTGGAPAETAPANVMADPGVLAGMAGQVGQTLAFRVTAPQPNGNLNQRIGGVFGTDIYTVDSSLAVAAVHAGALQPGQTGVVRVTILGPQPAFQPSTRNGVTSHAYGPWPGFRIEPQQRAKASP